MPRNKKEQPDRNVGLNANSANAKKTVQSVLHQKASMAQGFLANRTVDK
jgi:hypothetical protein